jgi:hypothetical protein
MNYWKGLMIAAAIDLVWIMARPIAIEPPVPSPLEIVAELPPNETEIGDQEDSLMVALKSHPLDVDVIEELADFYAAHGWWDAALNPLARALQLDPSRRSLWVALDRALERLGRDEITDAELIRRAGEFVQVVGIVGDGCAPLRAFVCS